MKNSIYRNILLAASICLMMVPGVVFANDFDLETSGGMYVVKGIDQKKKLIRVGSSGISYNVSTAIYGPTGDKISIDELKKGHMIRFTYDPNKRYFLHPTATKIWLKSNNTIDE